ncbi:MAG: GDP-mannose 4,6-dehydratase [Euryarchaeota archaeon]|nr:GDP-mannose 4,6-dehydratase [Euryarchaeota archaeon]
MKKVLVTGGAGFIGSHLVDSLVLKNIKVNVLDNLSSGKIENIRHWTKNKLFNFFVNDLLKKEGISEAIQGCDTVFHLAANPEVRVGTQSPKPPLAK